MLEDRQRQWAGSRGELGGEAEPGGGTHQNELLCACRELGQEAPSAGAVRKTHRSGATTDNLGHSRACWRRFSTAF